MLGLLGDQNFQNREHLVEMVQHSKSETNNLTVIVYPLKQWAPIRRGNPECITERTFIVRQFAAAGQKWHRPVMILILRRIMIVKVQSELMLAGTAHFNTISKNTTAVYFAPSCVTFFFT